MSWAGVYVVINNNSRPLNYNLFYLKGEIMSYKGEKIKFDSAIELANYVEELLTQYGYRGFSFWRLRKELKKIERIPTHWADKDVIKKINRKILIKAFLGKKPNIHWGLYWRTILGGAWKEEYKEI